MALDQLSLPIYVAGGIAQAAQLALQVYSYRRVPHVSLAMLAIATLAGLAYLGAALLATHVPAHSHLMQAASLAMVLCFGAQVVLGVWGTAALLSSHRRLAGLAAPPAPRPSIYEAPAPKNAR